jgi:ribosomal protein S18 acetylase RimI-like enzyme
MLREATISDASAIRCLMQRVPGFWQPWWSDQTVRAALESAKGLALVWEVESQIVGFICAHDLGFRAYLSELVVDPGIQQQGIGLAWSPPSKTSCAAENSELLSRTFGAMLLHSTNR